MTLAVRVIATLLIDPARGVIKGRQFTHDRVIGEPIQWARVMAQLREVDQVVVFDITHNAPDFALLERISSECFIPLSYGGGIHDIETVGRIIAGGADQVILRDPHLITKVAERFGSQAACAVINYRAFAVENAKVFIDAGAGEILLQSISRDGMMQGYDLETIRAVGAGLPVPLIASSGAGTPQHFIEALRAGADAVAAGSIWAFTDTTPNDVKLALKAAGYPVRMREAIVG